MRTHKTSPKAKNSKKAPKVIYKKIWLREYEIPNDDLIRAMKEGEKHMKSGKVKWYTSVEEIMKAHEDYAKKHKK